MKWKIVGIQLDSRRMERAKVPGGWFVRWLNTSDDAKVEFAFFYPDPLYDWDGTSI